MFCANCGKELDEGSKFCGHCGEKQIEESPEGQPVAEETAEVLPAAQDAQPETVTEEVQPEETAAEAPEQEEAPLTEVTEETAETGKKKKSPVKTIIGIAVALILVAALAVGAYFMFFNKGNDEAFMYYSKGKYGMVTNLKKGETFEFASAKTDYDAPRLVFTPDGKYVYYFTKYNPANNTGTLCRAEYGKLKDDSDKNSKHIETIASDVYAYFDVLEDGSAVYNDNKENLLFFNGEEEIKIGKNVKNFNYYTDGISRVIYISQTQDGERTLYGVDLTNPEEKIKLASQVNYIQRSVDYDNIIFSKYDEEGNSALYVVGFDKEAEKLVENGNAVMASGEKLFIKAKSGTALNLYDYVVDPDAAKEAGVLEPDMDDFTEPVYKYTMLSGKNLQEDQYDLYTSCTKSLYWFGKSTYWSYSMDKALNKDWGDNTDAIHAAILTFIDAYGHTADADGYIKVTPEVKAALQEIAKLGDEPEEWQWMWLCFNKRQSGTTTDYEAYEQAWNQWYEAAERNYLREELQNPENSYLLSTLYCYENGSLNLVAENVVATQNYPGGIMYNTADMIDGTMDIQDVYYADQVKDLFALDNSAQNYVLLADGTVCRMSGEAAEAFGQPGYSQLAFTADKAYLNRGDGSLQMASVSGGTVGQFRPVADGAVYLGLMDNTLYYAAEIEYKDGVACGSIYTCIDGETACIAEDVIIDEAVIYADGAVAAYTDYEYAEGYELTLIGPDGEEVRIDDKVTSYIRADEAKVLYISDGNLYVYNGKDKIRLKKAVDTFWSLSQMEIERILYWDDDLYQSYYDSVSSAPQWGNAEAAPAPEYATMPAEEEYY